MYRQRLLEMYVKAECLVSIDAYRHVSWLIEQELSRTGGDTL